MGSEALLAFMVVLGLLAAAALARRLFASGWQRNALSVVIVVLGLTSAFMFFFGAGSFIRSRQQPPKVSNTPFDSRWVVAITGSNP